jgi:predicted MFS family arabinose efflux permease
MVVALGFPYQGFLASITRDEFHRGAVGLGVLSSATAVGALIATLGVATLTNHRHVWRMQALAGLAFGASLVAFGFSPTFVIGLVTAFLVGGTASAFQSLNSALSMMLSEARYYGRVQALMGLSWSLFGIISLPLGIIADAIGIRQTLALMGLASIASIVVLELVGRSIGAEEDMNRRRAEQRRDPFGRDVATPAPADATLSAEGAGVARR